MNGLTLFLFWSMVTKSSFPAKGKSPKSAKKTLDPGSLFLLAAILAIVAMAGWMIFLAGEDARFLLP